MLVTVGGNAVGLGDGGAGVAVVVGGTSVAVGGTVRVGASVADGSSVVGAGVGVLGRGARNAADVADGIGGSAARWHAASVTSAIRSQSASPDLVTSESPWGESSRKRHEGSSVGEVLSAQSAPAFPANDYSTAGHRLTYHTRVLECVD
jgi:hypothetical protein